MRRTKSGVWVKRELVPAAPKFGNVMVAVPRSHLLVRGPCAPPVARASASPEEILGEMRAPAITIPPPEPTMEVLPWDMEVVEDREDLRARLAPPVVWEMPALDVRPRRSLLSWLFGR